MYCKIVDKNTIIELVGKILKTNNKIYANPTESTLRQNNYKPLILATQLDDREGYYRVVTYTEDKDNIYGIESYVEIAEEIS